MASEEATLLASVEKAKTNLQQLNSKETSLEENITKLTKERDNISVQISEKETKLKDLKEKSSLYTESLAGLVEEGIKQTNLYSRLIAVTIVALSFCGVYMVLQFQEIIYSFTEAKRQGLALGAWDYFILRAPYSPILFAFVLGAFALITKLLNSILEIQGQRRSVITLSILAGEISKSSAEDLDLSEDEVYKLKENLKFDLLSVSGMKNIFEPLKEKRARTSKSLTQSKIDEEE